VKKQQRQRDSEMGTILVPTDFSSASKQALKRALNLTHDPRRVLLLHVIPPPLPQTRPEMQRLIKDARSRLVSFSKDGADHPIESLVAAGTPFQEILAVAKKKNTALIVLGINSSINGDIGYTAERVSRYAKCAVLLLREDETISVGSAS
jgi:nucleotide-binding universal stress UspA family protein